MQLGEELQPAVRSEPDVENHDVDVAAKPQLPGILDRRALADDRQVIPRVQERRGALANDRVIIDDRDPDRL